MKRTSLNRTVAPVAYPVTVAHAKDQLRVSDADADADMIERMIGAATDYVENKTNRALVQQSWALKLDGFPLECGDRGRFIELPKCPAQSVTSITYVDANGATQTLASDQYVTHADGWQPFVCEAYGVSWPSTRCQPGAVTVTFVAGYAPAGNDLTINIPDALKQAILMHVQGQHDNLQAAEWQALEQAIKNLITPYRVPVY